MGFIRLSPSLFAPFQCAEPGHGSAGPGAPARRCRGERCTLEAQAGTSAPALLGGQGGTSISSLAVGPGGSPALPGSLREVWALCSMLPRRLRLAVEKRSPLLLSSGCRGKVSERSHSLRAWINPSVPALHAPCPAFPGCPSCCTTE